MKGRDTMRREEFDVQQLMYEQTKLKLDNTNELNEGKNYRAYHVSVLTKYLPQWIEYKGNRIYSNNLELDNKQIFIQDNVRRIQDYYYINDMFDYLGINKKIIVGDYEDTCYIEIK